MYIYRESTTLNKHQRIDTYTPPPHTHTHTHTLTQDLAKKVFSFDGIQEDEVKLEEGPEAAEAEITAGAPAEPAAVAVEASEAAEVEVGAGTTVEEAVSATEEGAVVEAASTEGETTTDEAS